MGCSPSVPGSQQIVAFSRLAGTTEEGSCRVGGWGSQGLRVASGLHSEGNRAWKRMVPGVDWTRPQLGPCPGLWRGTDPGLEAPWVVMQRNGQVSELQGHCWRALGMRPPARQRSYPAPVLGRIPQASL